MSDPSTTVGVNAKLGYTYHPAQRLLIFDDGTTVLLKPISSKLFAALFERLGEYVSDEDLSRAIWGPDVQRHGDTLRSHVALVNIRLNRLVRRKCIVRINGGYRLSEA